MRPMNIHHKRDDAIMTVLWPYCLPVENHHVTVPSTRTRALQALWAWAVYIAFTHIFVLVARRR